MYTIETYKSGLLVVKHLPALHCLMYFIHKEKFSGFLSNQNYLVQLRLYVYYRQCPLERRSSTVEEMRYSVYHGYKGCTTSH